MGKKIGTIIVVLIVVCIFGIMFYKNLKVKTNMNINTDLLPAVGKVVSYSIAPTEGTIEERENSFIIELYSDKSLKYGYFYDESMSKRNLSESQYKEIINLAFAESFSKVPDDIGNNRIMDGSRAYINLYYLNGTSKKVGGINPKNSTFEKLVNLLSKYTK